jgi:hypothetical protein
LKDRRIRVNALCPGYIDTAPWRSAGVTEIRANIIPSGTPPSGRHGTSDEVAKVAVFLASDDSGYVTETELFVLLQPIFGCESFEGDGEPRLTSAHAFRRPEAETGSASNLSPFVM